MHTEQGKKQIKIDKKHIIFECAHLKLTVYGRKQARTYVNTLLQCSPASVGLAQARPNYAGPLSCILGCNLCGSFKLHLGV